MTKDELIRRTKVFAVAVVKLVRTLPNDVDWGLPGIRNQSAIRNPRSAIRRVAIAAR